MDAASLRAGKFWIQNQPIIPGHVQWCYDPNGFMHSWLIVEAAYSATSFCVELLACQCPKILWRYSANWQSAAANGGMLFRKKNLVPTQSKFKLGLSVQITFCIFICCFFFIITLRYLSLYIYVNTQMWVRLWVFIHCLRTQKKTIPSYQM